MPFCQHHPQQRASGRAGRLRGAAWRAPETAYSTKEQIDPSAELPRTLTMHTSGPFGKNAPGLWAELKDVAAVSATLAERLAPCCCCFRLARLPGSFS